MSHSLALLKPLIQFFCSVFFFSFLQLVIFVLSASPSDLRIPPCYMVFRAFRGLFLLQFILHSRTMVGTESVNVLISTTT